jgi:chromosome segregation ATPase
LAETQASMSKISDQNILLRAQLTAAGSGGQQNGYADQQQRVVELEHQVALLMNEKSHQNTRINFYESENARLLTEIEQLKAISVDSEKMRTEKAEFEAKIAKMGKDQEDLLELLADQDGKLGEYRKRLKSLAQPVSDDDDEED